MSVTIYKTFSQEDIDTRRTVSVDDTTKQNINTTLSNFVT